ncbi:hypothetical protein T06_14587, partial [Trichinella sp. T6]
MALHFAIYHIPLHAIYPFLATVVTNNSEPVVQNDRHAILQGEFLPPQTVGGMRHREEHADRWGQFELWTNEHH